MTESMTDERYAEIRELLDRLPAAPWFVSDCEDELEVWQESALLNVSRDESGRITGYRTPASFLASNLLYEASLDTWNRGEEDGEDDDLRRDIAEFLAACRNELPALLAGVDRLRAEVADLQGQNAMTESHFSNYVAEAIVTQDQLRKRAETAEEKLRQVAEVPVHTGDDGGEFVLVADLAAVLLPAAPAAEPTPEAARLRTAFREAGEAMYGGCDCPQPCSCAADSVALTAALVEEAGDLDG